MAAKMPVESFQINQITATITSYSKRMSIASVPMPENAICIEETETENKTPDSIECIAMTCQGCII